ncbi:MAG: 5'-methylthioadenosine/S-adenosylhomocysteine nucleosidase [Oscillospiraceae bacterium]|nr:5'-methylthioadenosine/S-adenosylhomocysteine nucleosidase [Oscillospiraceae bacterium]
MQIGLSYAMSGEIESILKSTGAKLLETVSGVPVYEIEPGILAYAGGIGKVNAAMSAQLFIDRYHPGWIVNAGVAGSFLDLPVGTVVLADSFVQHDVDTSAIGDPVGLVSTVNKIDFPTSESERMQRILRALNVPHKTGRVATGEVFMTKGERADWISETFGAILCEMEGGAVAQVCLRNNVKFTALKSVSDRLCHDNNAGEYFNFGEAMAKLNTVVLPFAQAIRDEKY